MQRTQPDLVQRLRRVNPTSAFLAALVVILAGLFLPGIVGGLVLLVLAGGLVVLMRMTWQVQAPRTRAVRLAILALLIAFAVFYKIL